MKDFFLLFLIPKNYIDFTKFEILFAKSSSIFTKGSRTLFSDNPSNL
jgi:hypothetical protein